MTSNPDVRDDYFQRWTQGVEAIERGGAGIEHGAFVCQSVIVALAQSGWGSDRIAHELGIPVSYVAVTLPPQPSALQELDSRPRGSETTRQTVSAC